MRKSYQIKDTLRLSPLQEQSGVESRVVHLKSIRLLAIAECSEGSLKVSAIHILRTRLEPALRTGQKMRLVTCTQLEYNRASGLPLMRCTLDTVYKTRVYRTNRTKDTTDRHHNRDNTFFIVYGYTDQRDTVILDTTAQTIEFIEVWV